MFGGRRPAQNRAVPEIPDNGIIQEISRIKGDLLFYPGGQGTELDVSSFDNSDTPLICSCRPGRRDGKGPGGEIDMKNARACDRRFSTAEIPSNIDIRSPAGQSDGLLDIGARRRKGDGGGGRPGSQDEGPDKKDEAHKGFHSFV